MTGGGFTPEDELFFAEDTDTRGGGCKANGHGGKETDLGHGLVVDGARQESVGWVEDALEIVTARIG